MLGLGNEWHLSSFRGTQELYNKTKQKKKKKEVKEIGNWWGYLNF